MMKYHTQNTLKIALLKYKSNKELFKVVGSIIFLKDS